MKRLLFFITILTLTALPLYAQKGMAVAALFDGRYKNRPDATEVLVKGRPLKSYGLTLFRSLTLKPSAAEAKHIEQLVRTDGRQAIDQETGMKNGRLYYGFYCFPPRDGHYRYLFYRNDAVRSGRQPDLTLIYMEGTVSLDQLKRMFTK